MLFCRWFFFILVIYGEFSFDCFFLYFFSRIDYGFYHQRWTAQSILAISTAVTTDSIRISNVSFSLLLFASKIFFSKLWWWENIEKIKLFNLTNYHHYNHLKNVIFTNLLILLFSDFILWQTFIIYSAKIHINHILLLDNGKLSPLWISLNCILYNNKCITHTWTNSEDKLSIDTNNLNRKKYHKRMNRKKWMNRNRSQNHRIKLFTIKENHSHINCVCVCCVNCKELSASSS